MSVIDPSCSMEILFPPKAATLFRPEDVCALESMVSAWAHLSDVGVDSLTSHDAVAKFLVKIKKRHDSLLAQVCQGHWNTLTKAAVATPRPQ